MREEAEQKIKVGVAGATGYVGLELCRLIMKHPKLSLQMAGSRRYAETGLADYHPAFRGLTDLVLSDAPPEAFADMAATLKAGEP